jgi:uncharacterized protein YbbK (DUF523 family)
VSARVVVSACLLGERVRWDGEHRGGVLPPLPDDFEFVPVCPEVAAGLGVPRPPIRLERERDRLSVRPVAGGDDLTAALAATAEPLEALPLAGAILARRSPSCGPGDAPVHVDGRAVGRDDGAFVAALRRARPGLPCVAGERLRDPVHRAAFLERVRARAAWLASGGDAACRARLEPLLTTRGDDAVRALAAVPTAATLDALLARPARRADRARALDRLAPAAAAAYARGASSWRAALRAADAPRRAPALAWGEAATTIIHGHG